jgi:crossover junction endodeoxyribonuclease RusA
MIEIRLPWPPSELSPNSRLHWAQLARAKKIYRQACCAVTQATKQTLGESGYLRVELTFYRPDRRSYDHDNLLSRMKAGLDGVADALQINDRRFNPLSVSVADGIGGYVMMRIYEKELEE